ncbi:MAG: NAD(P)H-hydrate epimerase, partial [Eubacteriales bacterium]|nr:NAD(P)H-hydrate epimerase [Eubacteriales bacterium]
MLYTITPSEMMRVERRMLEGSGTPALTLMERAAAHLADAALPYLRGGGRLLLLCGFGHNGGDGIAAARMLMGRLPAMQTTVWRLAGAPSPQTAAQWERLKAYAGRMTVVTPEEAVPGAPAGTACVIDALFGTGLNRPLGGIVLAMVKSINASGLPVVAADIPSGLNGNTGYPPEGGGGDSVIRADVTVTFHRPKIGLFLGDGLDFCGRVAVGDIGIGPAWDDAPGMALLGPGDSLLPPRRHNTNKGTYGRVLVLAGSWGMAGAAALSATAALRTGAGLVTVACPEGVVSTVQALCPCATCLPLPETDTSAAWERLQKALGKADALVAGCGLGQETFAAELIKRLIPWLCEHPLPTVLDADALNLLASWSRVRADADDAPDVPIPQRQPGAVHLPDWVTLTPHPGEAARLLGWPVERVTADQPS